VDRATVKHLLGQCAVVKVRTRHRGRAGGYRAGRLTAPKATLLVRQFPAAAPWELPANPKTPERLPGGG